MRAKPLVIYHDKCYDGFTAAWVFDKFYRQRMSLNDPEPEYFGAHYNEDPPDVTGREVYILDFSYPREKMIDIIVKSNRTFVYDHHKTAKADLEGLLQSIRLEKNINRNGDKIVFDMDRSGAGITYDELEEEASKRAGFKKPRFNGRRNEWLVDYIEDRDIWKHALPNSEAVSAYIATVPMTFEAWYELSRKAPEDVVKDGNAILAYIERYGKKAIENARFETIAGYRVPTVNIPYINCSEHLHTLIDNTVETYPGEVPFVASYFRTLKGEWAFSLRSEGDFDVSSVAKQFGGGGHKNAAGFKVDVLPWEQKDGQGTQEATE